MINQYKPYNLYSTEDNNFAISSFESTDTLHYTLKVNTNGEPSIYANKYKKTKKGNKSFQIPIEEGNAFYEPFCRILKNQEMVTFTDKALPEKKLRITKRENFIILTFTNPHNLFNVINIHIKDEDLSLFSELLVFLQENFTLEAETALKKQMS
jgi:hypothetical protein